MNDDEETDECKLSFTKLSVSNHLKYINRMNKEDCCLTTGKCNSFKRQIV